MARIDAVVPSGSAAMNRAMSSELAPSSSKKSASAETRSRPSTPASVSARTFSVPVSGSLCAPWAAWWRCPDGGGRLLRSTLPPVVIGISATSTR